MQMLRAMLPGVLMVALIQTSALSADSIRVSLLACLARGDVAGAIAMYEAQAGKAAPAWLTDLQVAYNVANQTAGKCQQVARIIHTAFTRLGQTPQYVAFKANEGKDYMVFELANGKNAAVSRTGYHGAVRIGNLIYDAYTGPLGMKLSDYLPRLQARAGITWEVVSTP